MAREGGKEELARFAIKTLLPLREQSKRIRKRLEVVKEDIAKLSEVVEGQAGELDDLKARVKAYLAQEKRDGFDCEDLGAGRTVADEEVEIELLRRRARFESSGNGGN